MSQQDNDRLELLYRVSQVFNSSLDTGEVFNLVMDEVIDITGAERGFLVLIDGDYTLTYQAARGMDHQTIESPEFEVSRSVIQRVIESREPLLSMDASAEDWRSGTMEVIGLRSLLCVPLIVKGTLIGVIYVDSRRSSNVFMPSERDLLAAVASNAAMAIDNARFYEKSVEQARREKEAQDARSIQTSLIPQVMPRIEGWELAGEWEPAREVSGDFYDFVPVENGRTGVVIADVSDKGMPSALFMSATRSLMRASIAIDREPCDCVKRANDLVCQDSTNGMFVSMYYMEIMPDGTVEYVNAGHNPPLLIRSDSGSIELLHRTGTVMGIFPDTWEQVAFNMMPGDMLVLYTDGVTEALNAYNEEFGMARLQDIALRNFRHGATALSEAIVRELRQFIGTAPQFDDITLVTAGFTG